MAPKVLPWGRKLQRYEYHNSGYQDFLKPQGVFYSSYDYSFTQKDPASDAYSKDIIRWWQNGLKICKERANETLLQTGREINTAENH